MLAGVILVIVLYAIRPRLGALAAAALVVLSVLFAVGSWIRKLR